MGKTKVPGGRDKGKGIIQEEGREEGREEEREEEEDVPRPSRPSKPTKPKRTKKPKTRPNAEPTRTTKPSPSVLLKRMHNIKFPETKWVDHKVLEELGIREDVYNLLNNMGLGGFFNMEHHTYDEAAKQFLATLTYYDDTSKELSDPTRAYIAFKVHSKAYKVTIHELSTIFGFQEGGEVCSLSFDRNELGEVWSIIGEGDYSPGVSKQASIRNPAIRYAHIVLANTLFARRENANVKEEELALLIEGLKPKLVTYSNGGQIRGQPRTINLAHFLVKRFLFNQDWIITTKDSKPKVCIGGLITPILLYAGVDLGPSNTEMEYLDAAYLARKSVLIGRIGNTYGYRFLVAHKVHKKVILPHVSITTLDDRDNIFFKPRVYHCYDPTRHGTFSKIPQKASARGSPPVESEDQDQEEVFGPERYYFDPYDEPISGPAIQAAHNQTRRLQRWNKWQDRSMKKVVDTVKDLKGTIKGLKKMIKGLVGGTRRSSPSKEAEPAEPEEETEVESRHSFHGTPSAAMMIYEPGRSSYQGEGSRAGKRKATRSPSTSGSGNPSYSLGTSSPSTEF